MKSIASVFLLLAAIIPGINDIAAVNKLKREAREAYLAGDYDKAAEAYTILTDSMGVAEDKVLLNLGHALFQTGDSLRAFSQYQRLINSSDNQLRSVALNQMGVLSNNPQEKAAALNYFKEAMRANPANEEARYNYQVLKKEIDEEKEQNKDQQQKDKENEEQKKDEQKDQENKQDQNQNKQDQQNQQDQQKKDQQQDQQNQQQNEQQQDQKSEEQKQEEQKKQEQEQQEQEGKEQQPQQIDPEKLKEMNISEEKARMILEAMRNSEIQYIQQNKRKGSKKQESGKPDW